MKVLLKDDFDRISRRNSHTWEQVWLQVPFNSVSCNVVKPNWFNGYPNLFNNPWVVSDFLGWVRGPLNDWTLKIRPELLQLLLIGAHSNVHKLRINFEVLYNEARPLAIQVLCYYQGFLLKALEVSLLQRDTWGLGSKLYPLLNLRTWIVCLNETRIIYQSNIIVTYSFACHALSSKSEWMPYSINHSLLGRFSKLVEDLLFLNCCFKLIWYWQKLRFVTGASKNAFQVLNKFIIRGKGFQA